MLFFFVLQREHHDSAVATLLSNSQSRNSQKYLFILTWLLICLHFDDKTSAHLATNTETA